MTEQVTVLDVDKDRVVVGPKLLPQNQSTPKQQNHVDRKTLQILQHAANGNGKLNGGKHGKSMQQHTPKAKVSGFTSPNCSVAVFHDPKPPLNQGVHCSRETQTEALNNSEQDGEDSGVQTTSESKQAFDLMVNEIPSETYWKDVAEERRRALVETLEENERLHGEIAVLQKENVRLTDIEKKAAALQRLLEDVLPNDDIEADTSSHALSQSTEEDDTGLSL